MKKFREGDSYLIKEKFAGFPKAMTVLLITKKAYQIEWHESGNITWEMKDNFIETYTLIENITTVVKKQPSTTKRGLPPPPIAPPPRILKEGHEPPPPPQTKTIFKTCPICHGMGNVPDPKSTAGSALCPLCQGNKMIPERTEIIQ